MSNCLEADQILVKSAAGERTFGFDFSAALSTGETITGQDHSVSPSTSPALVIVQESSSGSETQVMLRGGASDKDYTITAQVTTSNNQTIVATGKLRVC